MGKHFRTRGRNWNQHRADLRAGLLPGYRDVDAADPVLDPPPPAKKAPAKKAPAAKKKRAR